MSKPEPSPAKKCILVAEDNANIQELIQVSLEAAGFEVSLASNGKEALDRLHRQRPDLLLLDLQMPRLNGYNVLSLIRADPALRELPVIAITAYAMQGDRERALAAGFDGFLPKPVDRGVLLAELHRALQQRTNNPEPGAA